MAGVCPVPVPRPTQGHPLLPSLGDFDGDDQAPLNGGMLLAARDSLTLGEWFRQSGIPMLAILLVAVIVTVVARMLVKRFRRKLEGSPSVTQEINSARRRSRTRSRRPRSS
jgi:hypothetical protein